MRMASSWRAISSRTTTPFSPLTSENYGESDAAPEGVTFGEAESNDVTGAMNYLAQRNPALRYGALGFSMGGETVLYAACVTPGAVRRRSSSASSSWTRRSGA